RAWEAAGPPWGGGVQKGRVAVQVVLVYPLHAGRDQEGVEGVAGGKAVNQHRTQRVDVVEQVSEPQSRPRRRLRGTRHLGGSRVRPPLPCHAGGRGRCAAILASMPRRSVAES